MLPILDGPIKELSSITDLTDIVDEFEDIEILIFGEMHGTQQETILASNASRLRKLGYELVFLEQAANIQPIANAIKRNPAIEPHNRRFDIYRSFALAGMEMICIDVDDINYKGVSYRKTVSPQLKKLSEEYSECIAQSQKEISEDILKTKIVADSELDKLKAGLSSCFRIGPKSLQNFFSFINIDAVPDAFEKQAKSITLSQQFTEARKESFRTFGHMRNEHMAERIHKYYKRGRKAISYNGLGHVSNIISEDDGQMNLQAILTSKYKLQTLTVGMYGGARNNIYNKDAPQIWCSKELESTFSNNIHMAKLSDPCLFKPELREKLFWVDHYDDNNQSHEDIALHLPELSM